MLLLFATIDLDLWNQENGGGNVNSWNKIRYGNMNGSVDRPPLHHRRVALLGRLMQNSESSHPNSQDRNDCSSRCVLLNIAEFVEANLMIYLPVERNGLRGGRRLASFHQAGPGY